MTSLPHPLPSRTAQNIAALYGHEDDTLLAWQRFCAQAAETLRPQHDPERLTKALALTQGGHVEVEDDGFAVVTSGTTLYHVQADGMCNCPDYQHRGSTPCKHVLAVLIHDQRERHRGPQTTSPTPRRFSGQAIAGGRGQVGAVKAGARAFCAPPVAQRRAWPWCAVKAACKNVDPHLWVYRYPMSPWA